MVKSVSVTLGVTFQFPVHVLGVLLLYIVDAGIVSLPSPTHSVKYCAHRLSTAQNVAQVFPHVPLQPQWSAPTSRGPALWLRTAA